jgi:transposase-like protein
MSLAERTQKVRAARERAQANGYATVRDAVADLWPQGWTQGELCRLLGVNPQAIRYWRNKLFPGERLPAVLPAVERVTATATVATWRPLACEVCPRAEQCKRRLRHYRPALCEKRDGRRRKAWLKASGKWHLTPEQRADLASRAAQRAGTAVPGYACLRDAVLDLYPKGVTMAEIARRMHVSPASVQAWRKKLFPGGGDLRRTKRRARRDDVGA